MKIIKAFFPISEREVKDIENIRGRVRSLSTVSEKDLPGELSLFKTIKVLNNLRKKEVNPIKWYIIVVEIQTTEDNYHIQSSKYLGYYEYNKITNPYKRGDLVLKSMRFLFPDIIP